MEKVNLEMDYFEAGCLRGVLEKLKGFDSLPRSLQLKLDIIFTKAYLSHPAFGKKAKEDIKKYQEELKEIEKDHEK